MENEDKNNENDEIKNEEIKNKSDNRAIKISIVAVIIILVIFGISLIMANMNVFNQTDEMKKINFNSTFETSYQGNIYGSSVVEALDKIIQSNEKNKDKPITVQYNKVESSNSEDIKNIKSNIQYGNNYSVYYEYDNNGYINKAYIYNGDISDVEVATFNSKFLTMHSGVQNGIFMGSFIDDVIQSNKDYPNHIITVSYNGIETSNENDLANLKSKFTASGKFDISYEYDADGFINKANIN